MILRLPRFANSPIKQLPCKSSSSFLFLIKSTMHLSYFPLFFNVIILIFNLSWGFDYKIDYSIRIYFRILVYEFSIIKTLLVLLFLSFTIQLSFAPFMRIRLPHFITSSLYHFITILSKSINLFPH